MADTGKQKKDPIHRKWRNSYVHPTHESTHKNLTS